FFTNALSGQGQLRQRVAWALAQIFVVSNQKIGDPSGFTLGMNMLQKDAFGNFTTLLNDVTLSPTMGNYLDMVNNNKPDPNSGREPNENYARESSLAGPIQPSRGTRRDSSIRNTTAVR